MTYTIQALAGVAVALSAILGVVFRRTRKMLFKAFRIDENANKLIESPVNRLESAIENKTTPPHYSNSKQSEKPQNEIEITSRFSKSRITSTILCSAFFVLTLFLFSPVEIIVGNASDLTIGLNVLIIPLLIGCLVITAFLTLIGLLLKGKPHRIYVAVITALGVCMWVQSMFMNSGLPSADGRSVDWASYQPITTISLLVWIAIIVAATFLASKKAGFSARCFKLIGLVLLAVQVIATGILCVQSNSFADKQQLTDKNLYTVSSDENIIVFILDTVDAQDIEDLSATTNSLNTDFKDFTYYANTTGMSAPTSEGLPYLLTGVPFSDKYTFDEYKTKRWEDSALIKQLSSHGFTIDTYTDTVMNGMDYISPYVRNTSPLGLDAINMTSTFLILSKCALYRNVTWILKPLFEFYTGDLNPAIASSDALTTIYSVDDYGFYENLIKSGIAIDASSSKGVKYIHLAGAHAPYCIDENVEYHHDGETTLQQQLKGCLRIVNVYLQKLYELGLYDSSTIIITSDHGYWTLRKLENDLPEPTNPILFIKKAGETHSSLKKNYNAHTQQLVFSTMSNAAKIPNTYEKENSIVTQRYFYGIFVDNLTDFNRVGYQEYFISGDNNKLFSNWRKTGRLFVTEGYQP